MLKIWITREGVLKAQIDDEEMEVHSLTSLVKEWYAFQLKHDKKLKKLKGGKKHKNGRDH